MTLHGGPLDGEQLPVQADDPDPGVALPAPGCAYPGGRAWYAPDAAGTWTWQGDTP